MDLWDPVLLTCYVYYSRCISLYIIAVHYCSQELIDEVGEDVRVISAPYSTFVISLNSRRMWLPTRVNSGEEVKGFMSLDASLVKNSSWMIQGLVGLWFTPARGAGQDTLRIRRRTVLRPLEECTIMLCTTYASGLAVV